MGSSGQGLNWLGCSAHSMQCTLDTAQVGRHVHSRMALYLGVHLSHNGNLKQWVPRLHPPATLGCVCVPEHLRGTVSVDLAILNHKKIYIEFYRSQVVVTINRTWVNKGSWVVCVFVY